VKHAKIRPDLVVRSEPIAVEIEAEDPDREAVSFRYRWLVDGVPLPQQTGPTLPPNVVKRGQAVAVEIIPSDGSHDGEPYRTAAVTVGNTPPVVSRVSLTPESPQSGDRVVAHVDAGDPDYDQVDLRYRWFKNTTVVKEGDDAFLDTAGLAGSTVAVEVTPHDLGAVGSAVRSDAVVVRNSPPTIVSNPPVPSSLERYEYLVKAEDRDGDSITYQLETAPSGMTIDGSTGRLVWPIPASEHGSIHVKVIALDGQGGKASQEFDLVLSAGKSPPGAVS